MPSVLTFEHVSNYELALSQKKCLGIYIDNITRSNMRLSPNGILNVWDYKIETDRGDIIVSATGYR
jgi:hypothetical protein